MKRNNGKYVFIAACIFSAFALWTLLVCFVDVQTIGPLDSAVGLASLNGMFHNLTGVHMVLYIVTDWLGLVPIAVALGFAILGLVQWIRRKKLSKVDFNILVLGGFYFVTMVAYILFEYLAINFRPVLINGILEKSYPSSTTMLVICVMSTAMMQLNGRIKNKVSRWCVMSICAAFTVFMVIGRMISGVHWITDIIGGMLLSTALVTLYYTICRLE